MFSFSSAMFKYAPDDDSHLICKNHDIGISPCLILSSDDSYCATIVSNCANYLKLATVAKSLVKLAED